VLGGRRAPATTPSGELVADVETDRFRVLDQRWVVATTDFQVR